MNYILDIIATLVRPRKDNGWMDDIIDHYYDIKNEDECLVVICPSDSEYDQKCRIMDRIRDDTYIVLACLKGASVTIFREYKYKGEYTRLYSVPGTDERRIKI